MNCPPKSFDGNKHDWHNESMNTQARKNIRSTTSLFNERKAAQAAAYLLYKADGTLALIKLMKLMYLAERLSLKQYGETITGDAFVSMPHGPVLSMTYEHMKGALPSQHGGWETWIADRADNTLSLQDASMIRSPEQDLLALSEADLECLEETWTEYGHYDKWKLRNMTHNGLCPEWEDPGGSSKPIPMKKLLRVLGYSDEAASQIIARDDEQRHIEALFQSR